MFKKGDKVRRIQDEHEGMRVGDVAVLRNDQHQGSVNLDLVGYDWMHDSRKFELGDDIKETTSKWLKENAWYIRVESPEHSKLIQEWLFEHGIDWAWGSKVLSFLDSKFICNVDTNGEVHHRLLQTNDFERSVHETAQELKPNFKLTLEGVTLPEAPKKTEQQLKLQELEATIQKAQQEIQQLKEMK